MAERLGRDGGAGHRRQLGDRCGHRPALAADGAAVALAARRADRLAGPRRDDRAPTAAGAGPRGGRHRRVRGPRRGAAAPSTSSDGSTRVVNNAGMMLLGPIEDAPVEEWQRMVQLNVLGLMYTTHAALPHLLERGRARSAPGRRPREHLQRRRPGRPHRQRRLQRDEVGRERLLRVAAPGGHRTARPGLAGRARRRRDRARVAQPARRSRRRSRSASATSSGSRPRTSPRRSASSSPGPGGPPSTSC